MQLRRHLPIERDRAGVRRRRMQALRALAALGSLLAACSATRTTPLTYAPAPGRPPALPGSAYAGDVVIAPVEDGRPPWGPVIGVDRTWTTKMSVLSDVDPTEWVRRALAIALHETGAHVHAAT